MGGDSGGFQQAVGRSHRVAGMFLCPHEGLRSPREGGEAIVCRINESKCSSDVPALVVGDNATPTSSKTIERQCVVFINCVWFFPQMFIKRGKTQKMVVILIVKKSSSCVHHESRI